MIIYKNHKINLIKGIKKFFLIKLPNGKTKKIKANHKITACYGWIDSRLEKAN